MEILSGLTGWGEALLMVGVAVAAALLIHAAFIQVFRRVPAYRHLESTVVRSSRRPLRWLLVVWAVYLALPLVALPEPWHGAVEQILQVTIIVVGAWLVIGLTQVFQVWVESRYPADVADNLRARRVRTKVRLLRRVATVIVSILAVGLVLMTFPEVRRIGISIFASAGAAGLILGIAAQPTLSNLVAGLQLALAEPVRLDDVVIVNGEWGWIEEISMTYVVVRIWDLRRLVVPIRWFIENPFENWTRTTADILGTVFLYVDYRAPVDVIRGELTQIVRDVPQWDGRVCNLQVVDASERTMKLRALVSAASSPEAWELRCIVRERLIAFLRDEHPEALPLNRALVADSEGMLNRPLPPAALSGDDA